MSQLQDNLNEILRQKNAYLLPANLKKDVTLLGVTGTLESLDTSDANATASDIAQNKTAYVNGQKITGSVTEIASGQTTYGNGNTATATNFGVDITADVSATMLLRQGSHFETTVLNNTLATAISLTADKIVTGNTILGVVGTGGGTTAHDAVKLFTSSSDMNNDNDKVLGDIAIVYNNSTLTGLYVVTSVSDTLTYTPLPTQLSAITSGDVYLNKVVMGANNNIVTGTIPVNASEVDTAEATTESILGPEVEPSVGNQSDPGEGDLEEDDETEPRL